MNTNNLKNRIRQAVRRLRLTTKWEDLRSRMGDIQKRLNDANCEKGASNWLSSLQLNDLDFTLNNAEFIDALNLLLANSVTAKEM